jgi:plastocyanin
MKKLAVNFLAGIFLALPAMLAAADANGAGIVKGTITIGGKPAPDAVISIEGLPAQVAKVSGAARKTVIDQRNMKFIPAVVAIRVGDSVDFPNHDKAWHNVYSKGGANDFDLGLYPPGKTRNQTFTRPGVSRILCNAHPDMEAFVVVKTHPFFSTTDSRGNYEIRNVPRGKARVEVWAPNQETKSANVEIVRTGEVLAVDFDLKK